jgi:hypothetical protein
VVVISPQRMEAPENASAHMRCGRSRGDFSPEGRDNPVPPSLNVPLNRPAKQSRVSLEGAELGLGAGCGFQLLAHGLGQRM